MTKTAFSDPDDVVDFVEYQCMARTSCETLDDDDDANDYHSWLAKLGHDRTDRESEAATASRASEVDESASPSEDSQSGHVDPVIGKKRRASAVSTVFNAAKRQRRARTEEEVSDCARMQRNAEPCLIEIPDSQTDAGDGGLEATQEAHSEDINSATSRDEQGSDPSRRHGTLLL
ncbi:hypothetical protein OHC33_011030 [Knufia fluminis]|uniref:Uncharacterized protein n=1 Tax=Knufia fluminis TaxID=191047 RepID=A0AAN8EER3_9EURO|nr:hypothetical protein OHC33_011030 [Knufia fluminis]